MRYVAFYLICGLAANAAEIVTSAGSNLPGLGASGAISGVLAGYLVLYPSSHIRTLIPIGFLYTIGRIPAWVFIGLWFLLQLVEGAISLTDVSGATGGVAYSAHVGGFVAGLFLVRLFTMKSRLGAMQEYQAQAT